MEQRRLRLGDILDDYCPRERRVTNHAVVAMIEEDVKQTRCTTCEAEHAYKGGREPRRRKKTEQAALYHEVLAGMTEGEHAATPAGGSISADVAAPILTAPSTPPSGDATGRSSEHIGTESFMSNERDRVEAQPEAEQTESVGEPSPIEEGPVHRPLIRATLPRIEGQKETRQVPDFTIRHGNGNGRGNGGSFRGSQRAAGSGGNAQRQGGRRFQGGGGMPMRGPSPAPGSRTAGSGGGFRSANGPQRHGPKKRPR